MIRAAENVQESSLNKPGRGLIPPRIQADQPRVTREFERDEDEGRRGEAVASLVSGGCIVSGAAVRRSLLFTGVHLHSHAKAENTVILPYVDVGEHARLRDVVVDRGVNIPSGLVIGEDPELDSKRFRRTPNGVCLITQPMIDGLNL